MSRPKNFSASRWTLAAGAAIASLTCGSHPNAWAAGLTFVEASDLSNLTPSTAIQPNATATGTGDDNLWLYRLTYGTMGNIYESHASSTLNEDSPMLTQRVSGLTPGTSYDFYAVFWTDDDANWGIKAGTTPGNLTTTTYAGNTGIYGVEGSQKGVAAGTALWDVLPPATDDTPITTIFTERPADPLIMLLGKAGTAVANASGEVDIYIDDLASDRFGTNRSWFDGIAYTSPGGLSALTATINRDTGALTLSNPTNVPFQIKAISVNSPAGSLNAANWTPITGNSDGGGSGSFDGDPWVVTAPGDLANTPYATTLAEAESAATISAGGTLAAGGGTINFGNVWQKSFFEDVRIDLTLADGTLIPLRPAYTGTDFLAADYNRDSSIDVLDYQILLANINKTLPTMSRVESNALGDTTGGGLVDFDDYTLFRAAYDEANGVGAFAAMTAALPEPGSLALLLSGALVLVRRSRRRGAQAAAAMAVTCGLAASAEAVPLLAVDINARTGDTNGPTGENTVAGFSPFVLPTGTTVQVATGTIGTYGISLKSVNAAGVSTGSLADRDRAAPTGTPTMNQMYDDFVFVTGASVGIGGGIDLGITSGGGLQPNKSYQVSLYAYDNTSAAPAGTSLLTANWLDGNTLNANVLTTAFTGGTLPTTDDRYKFSGVFRTDASGNLLLKGRSSLATATNSVFLNGFTIEEVAPALSLEVNITTGAMRVFNEFATGFDMSYYAIRSAGGALNPATWTSFDDGEAGDPAGVGWDEAAASSATLLNELNLTSQTSFAQNASLSLGNGFTPGGALDVRFTYAAPGGALVNGIVTYVQSAPSIPGDFNKNGSVTGADLTEWKTDFGVDGGSDADGDNDSDGNDFLIWQRNFGQGAAASVSAAVPEPATITLSAMAVGGLAASRRRRV